MSLGSGISDSRKSRADSIVCTETITRGAPMNCSSPSGSVLYITPVTWPSSCTRRVTQWP